MPQTKTQLGPDVVLEVAGCGPGVVLMWSWRYAHAADLDTARTC